MNANQNPPASYEVRIIGGKVITEFASWADAYEAMSDFPKPSEFRYVFATGSRSEWMAFISNAGMF